MQKISHLIQVLNNRATLKNRGSPSRIIGEKILSNRERINRASPRMSKIISTCPPLTMSHNYRIKLENSLILIYVLQILFNVVNLFETYLRMKNLSLYVSTLTP